MNITSIMEKRKYTLTRILLQNTLNFYYKIRQSTYKMQQVLQSVPILLQNVAGITKRVDYYKTRHQKIK